MSAAAVQQRAKHATALAQWEKDQAERAQEQAEERHATQATYEAQLADSYAEATARAQDYARRATAQAESDEIRTVESLSRGEFVIPIWALWTVGIAVLVVAAAIAVRLVRRRGGTNIDRQDGNF